MHVYVQHSSIVSSLLLSQWYLRLKYQAVANAVRASIITSTEAAFQSPEETVAHMYPYSLPILRSFRCHIVVIEIQLFSFGFTAFASLPATRTQSEFMHPYHISQLARHGSNVLGDKYVRLVYI